MKTLKFFLYLSFLFIGVLSFTACSDDDDDDNGKKDEPKVETGWSESSDGNTLTFTATASHLGASATAKWTFVFADNKCSKATLVVTYPTAADAQEDYEVSYKNNGNATLSGKTITVDETEEYKGQSKAFIKQVIQAMAGHV